jgi:low temperature requirement protein LtrA
MIENAKRASWLELFYDVAFVAVVAQLTYLASSHYHVLADWVTVFIVGYSIFVAWWGTTANRNLQPSENTQDKLFIQLQMAGMFMMSITMPAVFEGHYIGFYLTLGLVRLLQAFMLGRMYSKHPSTRPVTFNLLQGFTVAGMLWIISAFTIDPYHYIVALAALSIDVLTPLTKGKGNTTRYLNVYHLQERLGLFLMLVIGESMIVVALSSTAAKLNVAQPTVVLSGLVLMIALWWLYFEHSDRNTGVRPKNFFIFLHSHGLLFASLILLSVGYRIILAEPNSLAAFWLIAVGVTFLSLSIIFIRSMLHNICSTTFFKVGGLFLLAVGALCAGYFYNQTVAMLASISILFCITAALDYFGKFRKK